MSSYGFFFNRLKKDLGAANSSLKMNESLFSEQLER